MKRPPRKNTTFWKPSAGFTLVEVIVVFTLAGILFSMMLAYFSTNILDTARPVVQLNQALSLVETAERITAHYQSNKTNLTILRNNLDNAPNDYGGNFTVVTNEYIDLSSYNDTVTAVTDILKVKIRHTETNETLTLVFSKQ